MRNPELPNRDNSGILMRFERYLTLVHLLLEQTRAKLAIALAFPQAT